MCSATSTTPELPPPRSLGAISRNNFAPARRPYGRGGAFDKPPAAPGAKKTQEPESVLPTLLVGPKRRYVRVQTDTTQVCGIPASAPPGYFRVTFNKGVPADLSLRSVRSITPVNSC